MLRNNKAISAVVLSFLLSGPFPAFSQVAWVKNFDAALKQAARENKFIVLDISASW